MDEADGVTVPLGGAAVDEGHAEPLGDATGGGVVLEEASDDRCVGSDLAGGGERRGAGLRGQSRAAAVGGDGVPEVPLAARPQPAAGIAEEGTVVERAHDPRPEAVALPAVDPAGEQDEGHALLRLHILRGVCPRARVRVEVVQVRQVVDRRPVEPEPLGAHVLQVDHVRLAR